MKESKAPDYSKKESWYQIPEITKDVDTFYIFATDYILSSFEEGAPDYAPLDNEEFLFGTKVEYRDHASSYEDATNVFAPYYRLSGLRYAGEVIEKTGTLTMRSWACPTRTSQPRSTTILRTATAAARSFWRATARALPWFWCC